MLVCLCFERPALGRDHRLNGCVTRRVERVSGAGGVIDQRSHRCGCQRQANRRVPERIVVAQSIE